MLFTIFTVFSMMWSFLPVHPDEDIWSLPSKYALSPTLLVIVVQTSHYFKKHVQDYLLIVVWFVNFEWSMWIADWYFVGLRHTPVRQLSLYLSLSLFFVTFPDIKRQWQGRTLPLPASKDHNSQSCDMTSASHFGFNFQPSQYINTPEPFFHCKVLKHCGCVIICAVFDHLPDPLFAL